MLQVLILSCLCCVHLWLQNISLVNFHIALNIEGIKYTVSDSLAMLFSPCSFLQSLATLALIISSNPFSCIGFSIPQDIQGWSMISQYLNGFFAQCVQVESIQGGPGSYLLRLNKSEIHAEAHTLRDGGLLVQVYMRSSLSLLLSRCRCSKPLYWPCQGRAGGRI